MPDTAYLSPGYGRAVCYIDTPVLKRTIGGDELLEAYQQDMFACGGFPHWGKKNIKLSGHMDKIKTHFPKLSEWQAVQKKYDPHKVDNLISTVDWNGQQIDGPTDKVMSLGNIRQKFDAFGWTTLEMNGNDMDDVVAVLEKAKSLTGQGKPIGIMMHTEMGKGVDFMEGSHEWHGIAPNDEQLAKALAQLPETLGDY